MFTLLITFIIFCFFIRYITTPRKPAILGIYQQKNTFFYLKYAFLYTTLKFKTLRSCFRKKNPLENEELESLKPLYDTSSAVDAVYFNGSSKDGSVLICAVARRQNKITNTFICLQVEGGEMLMLPCLPISTVKQTDDESGHHYAAGIKIDMVQPMKTWKIRYDGEMRSWNDKTKIVNVKVDAEWNNTYRQFNFDDDMSASATASAIATEMWSREYFNILEKVHQTHYEQFGILKGIVTIDGKEHKINLDCIRDHTRGKIRDWKTFHRYGLHFINLENGDNITVGNICMPICFSNLNMGFICKNDTKQIHPVEYCNLQLYQHGENRSPPRDYAFQFKAGGEIYTVQVMISKTISLYLGEENETYCMERMAKYIVNGVEGWGVAEWIYRNVDSVVL